MKKGTLCISIDTELLWRCSHNNYRYFIKQIRKERDVIEKILTLITKHDVPVTWAIVGKLFSESSPNEKDSDLLHAPDIIKKIRKIKGQEIASHSFTHPDFSVITLEKAEKEIKQCIKIAQRNRVNLNSFVFPRNRINHLPLLKKYGFKTFRGVYLSPPTILKPFWKLFELIDFLIFHPRLTTPSVTNGVTNIPGTMYYFSTRGLRKLIPVKLRSNKAMFGINSAIKEKKIFHLWFHPLDFVDNSQSMINSFEQILKYASSMRSSGKLEIKTMQEIANGYS